MNGCLKAFLLIFLGSVVILSIFMGLSLTDDYEQDMVDYGNNFLGLAAVACIGFVYLLNDKWKS